MEEELEAYAGVDGSIRVHLCVHSRSVLDCDVSHRVPGYFPRLVLLIPHMIALGVLLATHPYLKGKEGTDTPSPKVMQPAPPNQAGEGSVDYLANLQAIQNLMGAV